MTASEFRDINEADESMTYRSSTSAINMNTALNLEYMHKQMGIRKQATVREKRPKRGGFRVGGLFGDISLKDTLT